MLNTQVSKYDVKAQGNYKSINGVLNTLIDLIYYSRFDTEFDLESGLFDFIVASEDIRNIYDINSEMIMDLAKYIVSKYRPNCDNANNLKLTYCRDLVYNGRNFSNDEIITWGSTLVGSKITHTYESLASKIDDRTDVITMKDSIYEALKMREFIHNNFSNIGKTVSGFAKIEDIYRGYHIHDDNEANDLDLFKVILNHCGLKSNKDHTKYFSFDYTDDGRILFNYILPVTKF